MPKKRKKHKKYDKDIQIDQILFKNRQLFLFENIEEKITKELVREIRALDTVNHKPIVLYINSPGGSVSDGFAIIDAMKGIKSPVVTIITGEACSMAGLISIAGDKRYMTSNSYWMGHDLAGGIGGDYTTKVLDRAKYLGKYQKQLEDFIKIHTKLTDKDIIKGRHGELWLNAEECYNKGIVDNIIKYKFTK